MIASTIESHLAKTPKSQDPEKSDFVFLLTQYFQSQWEQIFE